MRHFGAYFLIKISEFSMSDYVNLHKTPKIFESPFGHIKYALCLNKKQFKRALKQLEIDVKPEFLDEQYGGVTHSFENTEGGFAISLVCINPKKLTDAQFMQILIHESVHVYQHIREQMCEKFPSVEFEAYSIDQICRNFTDTASEQR